ncbi:hypothetical protein BDK51DRAFT_44452 [Blyttiomyces helicus]|uniref:Uncharacterized protein n=1 Tax=Blyttiomyces helicus TaxID=388810 RepID=A0A4P9WFP4_9FUNG|nr:hypothetical protein BDK51DRAFT_44452 [Blyttiomyces helicus]|eukprot:RKO90138.1 hypothetical protein BDK51DRAFT_44452 [Blyttiomyces helicus]
MIPAFLLSTMSLLATAAAAQQLSLQLPTTLPKTCDSVCATGSAGEAVVLTGGETVHVGWNETGGVMGATFDLVLAGVKDVDLELKSLRAQAVNSQVPTVAITLLSNISIAAHAAQFSIPESFTPAPDMRLAAVYPSSPTPILGPRVVLSSSSSSSSPTAAASTTANGTTLRTGAASSNLGHIELILGIVAIAVLLLILSAWFLWRRHVRARPGFAARKARWTGAVALDTPAARVAAPASESPAPHVSLDIAHHQPGFRRCGAEVVPGTVLKAFTWQQAGEGSARAPASPFTDAAAIDRKQAPAPGGWDHVGKESPFGDHAAL